MIKIYKISKNVNNKVNNKDTQMRSTDNIYKE